MDISEDLISEFKWLNDLISIRLRSDHRLSESLTLIDGNLYNIIPPDLINSTSNFALFIKQNELSFEERVLLILAVAPHLKPEFLDLYINPTYSLQLYTPAEFLNSLIGTRGQAYKGLLPTGLTYLYILAGGDIKERIRLQNILSTIAKPNLQKAVVIQPHNLGEPAFSGRIFIVEEYLELFTIEQIDRSDSIKYSFNK
jgi:hypothetical protein